MDFRIADTFTASLARLSGDEQKAVKTTAFDLQLDRTDAGVRCHCLDRARARNFWSVRVNAAVRLIVHRTPGSLLLCMQGLAIDGRGGGAVRPRSSSVEGEDAILAGVALELARESPPLMADPAPADTYRCNFSPRALPRRSNPGEGAGGAGDPGRAT